MPTDKPHQPDNSLDKTSVHIFSDSMSLIRDAAEGIADAKNIGSNRSKGFTSVIILLGSLAINTAVFYGYRLLAPEKAKEQEAAITGRNLSVTDREVIEKNLNRILQNLESIGVTKTRVAPSMAIDQNLAAIQAAAEDVRTVVGIAAKAGQVPSSQ
jgi:hypothetical protein